MDKTASVKKSAFQKKEKSFLSSVVLGTWSALAIGLFLLTAVCFLGLSMKDPGKYTPMLALAVLFLSALIGGYLAARSHQKSGLACGALAGIFMVGTLVLAAFAFGLRIHISLFVICAPALTIISAISGVVGVGAQPKPKRKRKMKF